MRRAGRQGLPRRGRRAEQRLGWAREVRDALERFGGGRDHLGHHPLGGSSVSLRCERVSPRDQEGTGVRRRRRRSAAAQSLEGLVATAVLRFEKRVVDEEEILEGARKASSFNRRAPPRVSDAPPGARQPGGSSRSFWCNCARPTSTAMTRDAPCCNRQSVNPPVEAPRSRHTRPAGSTPNAESASSSFNPPRDTYRSGSETESSASSATICDALTNVSVPERTRPAETKR